MSLTVKAAAIPTRFVYIASTHAGKKRYGLVEGKDQRQAFEQLRRQRLVPLKAYALPKWAMSRGGGAPTLKDQAEVHTQLSQLIGRGVPLVEALEVVRTSVSPSTVPRIARLRELVSQGSGFADACKSTKLFDDITVAVYRAAERSGDLSGAAKQLATTTRRQLAISGKVVTLLIYPCIVGTLTFGAVLFLLMYVTPRVGMVLTQQAQSQGTQLPLFSRLVFGLGAWMGGNWLLVLLSLAGLVVLGVVLRRQVGAVVMRLGRTLPGFREVTVAQESARFFTVMGAMTRSGVTLSDALASASGAVTHPQLRSQLINLRTKLVEGGQLRPLLEGVTALPVSTRRLLVAAERSGDLDSAFEVLSQDMVEELARRSDRMLAALEPVLIVLMALTIGSIVLAIMIPLMSMASSVG